jgi:hypothetical protein
MGVLPGTKSKAVAHWILTLLGAIKGNLPPVAIFVLFAFTGCATGQGKNILVDIKTCGTPAVLQEIANLTPAITAILSGGAADWQAQLSALEAVGVPAVICAVEAIVKDLESRPTMTAKLAVDPLVRGRTYLAHHGIGI